MATTPIRYDGGLILNQEASQIPENGCFDINNVHQYQGVLDKLWGIGYYSNTNTIPATAPGTPILHIAPYYQAGVFQYYIAFSTAKTYKIEGNTYTEIFTQAFSSADPIDTTDWLDDKYIANPDIQIKYWNGTALIAPAGWANITAGGLVNFNTHLVLGNTIESSVPCRQRVRWSAIAAPNDTTSTTSGFVDLIDTPGEVVALKILGDRLFVLKADSIYECMYVGGEDTFKFVLVKNTIGCQGKDSVITQKDLMYLLGKDNVYQFDGRTFTAIGDNVKDFFASKYQLGSSWSLQYAKMMYFEPLNELWVAIPSSSNFARNMFVLNLTDRTWWKKSLDHAIYSMMYLKRSNQASWTDALGTWGSQTLPWDDALWGVVKHEVLLGGTSAVSTARFDTAETYEVATTGYWVSRELVTEAEIRFLEVNAEIQGSVECLYSSDSGNTWVSLGNKVSNSGFSKVLWEINKTFQKVMFKFVLGVGSVRMKNVILAYKPRKGWRR
jgi:hypothetical protein